MSNLLLKEWVVNKLNIVISIAIILMATVIVTDTQLPIFYAVLISCIYPFSTTQTDSANKSNILIQSLPVKPTAIVSSKYVFSLLLGVVAVIAVVVINAIVPVLEANGLFEVVLSMSAVGWFIAVYYPLFYLLGQRFITYALVAFFILCFAVVPIVLNVGAENDFWGLVNFSTLQLSIVTLIITIVALIISWIISGQIVKKKEL